MPAPPQPFGGKIEPEASKSTPYWPARIVPPKGAPNVLLIITDDAGFGVPSTFGGVIPTPTMDRIAREGLRYTNVQLDRAVLADARRADHGPQPSLGRLRRDLRAGDRLSRLQQHHRQGQGDDRAHPAGQRLSTSWFGKDHNTPAFAASQAGPFDQWPTGMGFEYFYGFVGGDANQWEPNLFRNTTQIYPFVGKPDWNLITAMADDAIDWINRMNQTSTRTSRSSSSMRRAPRTRRITRPRSGWRRSAQMHLFDEGWNKLREHDLREPEEARRDPAGREADALAQRHAEGVGPAHARRRRSSSSGRWKFSPPTRLITITRSAG